MRHKSLSDAGCPVARSLDVIGDWWSLLIVRDALLGKTRFGEFRDSLGLAKNILAARLKKLVAEGILELVPAADGSAYQQYRLTEKGRDLYVVVAALAQWGNGCLFAPDEARRLLVDRATDIPLPPIELRSVDGRVLGAADTRLTAPGEIAA
jgi:DNA-binding HxlR family transcriptional regulator